MHDRETVAASAAPRGRVADVVLWGLQALLAALFAFAGVNKLLGLQQEMIDQFARIGAGVWFRYFVGAVELVGAIGLMIPRVSGLAALGLAGVMAGAVLAHLFVLPPVAVALVPATLGLLLGLIARARWPGFRHRAGALDR